MKRSAKKNRDCDLFYASPEASRHARYKTTTVYIPPSESNDNAGHFKVSRNIDANLMDAWLLEDSIFDGLHLRAAHECRALWSRMPTPTHRTTDSEGHSHARAAKTLAKFKRSVPLVDWRVFENAMRWNEPGGYPGSKYANQKQRDLVAAKMIVRRVLETIAR